MARGFRDSNGGSQLDESDAGGSAIDTPSQAIDLVLLVVALGPAMFQVVAWGRVTLMVVEMSYTCEIRVGGNLAVFLLWSQTQIEFLC